VGNTNGEKRQVSTVVTVILAVAIGLALAFFGVTLVTYGAYALNEGEVLIGVLAILFGLVLLGFLIAIVVSQLRSLYDRRG
jgi:O-antigen/teichoic acid export membrane protein